MDSGRVLGGGWVASRGLQGRREAGVLTYLPYFGLACLVATLVRFQAVAPVLHGALQDPDSYMRLVRIQDALDAGHWFGHAVARDASGAGFILTWSHALDGVILLLRAPLRLVLAPGPALFWAGVGTGPLSLGALGAATAWAAAPLAGRAWLWMAPVAVAVSPAILNYGELGFVTHHIALVALAVAAWGAAGRAAFGGLRAGLWAGALAGLGIWLSPEAMPFGLMGLGAVFVGWAVRPARPVAGACLGCGLGLLAVVAVTLVVDPPAGGLGAVALDRLSLPFLVLAGFVALLGAVPRLLGRCGIWARFAGLGGAGLGMMAAWLALFPGFSHGLAGLMTAEQAQAFFGHIQEMAPLDTPGMFVLFALAGALAAVATLGLAAAPGQPPVVRAIWLYAGLCAAACVGLAVMHLRFSPYPAAAAAAMLPVLFRRLSAPRLLSWRPLLRPGLLVLFLCTPGLLGRLLIRPVQAEEGKQFAAYQSDCSVAAAAGLLAPYAGSVVLAQVGDGPELLYRTRVAIVGSLYHPDIAGFMRLRAAWRARDLRRPPPELLATGATALLICPHHARMALVDGPATTLFDRLNQADPPTWLHAEAGAQTSPWVLYRVLQDGSGG